MFNLDKIIEEKIRVNPVRPLTPYAPQEAPYNGGNEDEIPQQAINRRAASVRSNKGDLLIGSDDYNRIILEYDEWPKSSFTDIPPKSFVRYIVGNVLKKGGKVLEKIETANGVGLRLMTPYSRNAAFWVIYASDFDRIFVKHIQPQKPLMQAQPLTNSLQQPSTNSSTNPLTQPFTQPPTPQAPIFTMQPQSALSQLGDKLLFEDADSLSRRIDSIERKMQSQDQLIQRLIKMIDALNKKITT